MSYYPLTRFDGSEEDDFEMFKGHLSRSECEEILKEQHGKTWEGFPLWHGYARDVPAAEDERFEDGQRAIRFCPQGRGAFKVTCLGHPHYPGHKHLWEVDQ